MSVVQLAFDISLDPLYRWENYFISPANEDAVSWIRRWPRWSGRTLLIYGPEACGKTHLAHLWRSESRACIVDESVLSMDHLAEYVAQNPFLILENADRIQDMESFLHLYNLVHECQGYLLMTARSAPSSWNIELKDLSSRLATTPLVEIQKPNDDLMQALFIKAFSDHQLRVSEGVLSYILKRTMRSYKAVQEVTNCLNRLSLEQRRNITLPLVRTLFSED